MYRNFIINGSTGIATISGDLNVSGVASFQDVQINGSIIGTKLVSAVDLNISGQAYINSIVMGHLDDTPIGISGANEAIFTNICGETLNISGNTIVNTISGEHASFVGISATNIYIAGDLQVSGLKYDTIDNTPINMLNPQRARFTGISAEDIIVTGEANIQSLVIYSLDKTPVGICGEARGVFTGISAETLAISGNAYILNNLDDAPIINVIMTLNGESVKKCPIPENYYINC